MTNKRKLAGNPIYTNDIFDSKKIAAAIKQLQGLDNAIKNIEKRMMSIKGGLMGASPATGSGRKRIATGASEVDKMSKELKQLKAAYESVSVATQRWNNAQRQSKALANAEAVQIDSLKNSYNDQAAELKRLKILLRQYTEEQKNNDPAVKKMVLRARQLNEALGRQERMMSVHTRNVGNYRSALGKLGTSLKNLISIYLGVHGAMTLVSSVFRNTKDLDALDFAIKKVITNQSELAQTQQFLSEITEKYGNDIIQATKSYTKFRAATKSTNFTVQETQRIFESFAKTSAVLGLNNQETREVFLALEQIISKGKVSTEELRRQLGEKVPGAFNIMANALNVTVGELDDMLRKGEVLSEDALPKFVVQLEKAFGLEHVDRIDTLAAAQGRFNNAWVDFVKSLEANNVFSDFFNTMASGLGVLKNNLNAILNLTKAFVALTAGVIAFKVAGEKSIFSLKRMRDAWVALNIAISSNPIGAITGVLVALTSAVILYRKEIMEAATSTDRANNSLEDTIVLLEQEKRIAADLFEVLIYGNNEYGAKEEALNRLKGMYPQYLKDIDDEKSSILEIAKAQKKVNDMLLNNIAIREFNRESAEMVDNIDDLKRQIVDLQIRGRKSDFWGMGDILKYGNPKNKIIGLGIDIQDEQFNLERLKRLYTEKFGDIFDFVAPEDSPSGSPKGGGVDSGLEKQLLKDKKNLELSVIRDSNSQKLAEFERYYSELRDLYKGNKDMITLIDKAYLVEFNKMVDDLFNDTPIQPVLFGASSIPDPSTFGESNLVDNIDSSRSSSAPDRTVGIFNKKIQELKWDEQLALNSISNLKNTEEEKLRIQKEFIKKRLQLYLDYYEKVGQGEFMVAKMLRIAIGNVNKELNVEKGGEPKSFIDMVFPNMTDEKKQLISESVSFAIGQTRELLQAQVQFANQNLQLANQRVASAERAFKIEADRERDGLAHKMETRQKELDQARQLQKQAEDDRRKAQLRQIELDALTQSTNLITATSKIWKDFGFPLAIPLTGLMWGSFLASKIKARQLVKKKYAKGTKGVEIIGGGSHASGDDTYVGEVGGGSAFAEKGEAMAIWSKGTTSYYGKPFLDLVTNSIRDRNFENMFAISGEHKSDVAPHLNLGTLETGIGELVRQGQEKFYRDGKGRLVTKYKNLTKRYA